MGARLTKRAYLYAIDVPLNPNEFRLLCWMAMTAIDDDDTPRYFDSRESSALALGRRVVDGGYGDENDQLEREAAFQAVKVALNGLVALGAIDRVVTGRNGRRSEYALILDAIASAKTPEGVKRRASKVGRTYRQRYVEPTAKGRPNLPPRVGPAYPQGTTQETQGTTAGETTTPSLNPLAAVDNSEVFG